MNKIIVIKIGGAILEQKELLINIIDNIHQLYKQDNSIALVHGGSKQIDREMQDRNIPIRKIAGKRYTDKSTLEVLDKCCGELNEDIVNQLRFANVQSTGLHAKTNLLMFAKKTDNDPDLGLVGKMTDMKSQQFKELIKNQVAVVSPVVQSIDGQLYNVNADDVAEFIATSLGADKLVLMTDVDGVYINKDGNLEIIGSLTAAEIKKLLDSGMVTGGMIPKLQSSMAAVQKGLKTIHIVNGTKPDVLIQTIKNQPTGTTITK
jgi:acetylglutamate kinase